MGRVVLLFILFVALIAFEYSRRKNLKKSLFSVAILLYLFGVGYSGTVLMRVVAPLYFVHLLFIIIGFAALLWYLWSSKLYWYLFVLPLATIALYVVLNLFDGSRYEALKNFRAPVILEAPFMPAAARLV